MGLFDKLRGELVDIVEWIDDTNHTLVWRFPRYHNQIKNGAQLIVRPGQTAVFVHRGELADVFEPGHYELTTDNLPILGTLQGWKHGFDSPFKSEVYFVRTTQITDLKWGTPNPIMLRDPDFGPIRLRAFGTYTLKAVDPRALLKELVGTDSDFSSDEINELMRSIISEAFAVDAGQIENRRAGPRRQLPRLVRRLAAGGRRTGRRRIRARYPAAIHREHFAARGGRKGAGHPQQHGGHRRHEPLSNNSKWARP